jgi:hypothetical protein
MRHPEDAARVVPAYIREKAGELLAVFGEDDGARLLLLCAERIEELEALAPKSRTAPACARCGALQWPSCICEVDR